MGNDRLIKGKLIVALTALCVAAVSQPLGAQGTISAGQTVSGQLDASDYVRDSDNTYYDDWFYEGRAGERISVTQRSSDFDSWLLIGRVVNGEFQLDEFNDDAAGGNDARIEMTLPTTGRYVIRVNVVGRGRTGAYTLNVTRISGGSAGTTAGNVLSAGRSFTGALESSDAVWTDNTYYDLWRYQGRAGELLTIVMRSTSFNSYMQLGRMNGNEFSYIRGSTSRTVGGQQETVLEVTLPATGEYGIRANSHGRNTGRYTISVTSSLPATAGPSTTTRSSGAITTGSTIRGPLQPGQTVSGALDSSDSTMADGTRYELWRFSGQAGQRLRITMRSSAFDPYMTIGTFANGSYSYIMGDDNGGEGSDARIEYTLPRSGEYAIRANSMGRATGPYTITLQTY